MTDTDSSGIGYTTTEQLARHSAKLYVAARSEAKAHAAIEKIYANKKSVETGKLVFLPLDLADLDSVVKAAEILLEQETKLDVLELQCRMDAENIAIISTSLRYGLVATEGQAGIRMGWLEPVWWLVKTFMSKSPEKGAVPSLYLAVGTEARAESDRFKGLYCEVNCKAVAPSKLAGDPRVARALWKLSEETVKKWTA